MQAVSIPQPQAGAILAGPGPVEYRSWLTSHRGPLLIHAARPRAGKHAPESAGAPVCNVILGVVELTDCVRDDHPGADPDEVGYYWVLAQPRVFDTPLPYNGKLGLFSIADRLVADALGQAQPPAPRRRGAAHE